MTSNEDHVFQKRLETNMRIGDAVTRTLEAQQRVQAVLVQRAQVQPWD